MSIYNSKIIEPNMSDHKPVIAISAAIKLATYNIEHCFFQYEKKYGTKYLQDNFCIDKETTILEYIKINFFFKDYDFIFLQECTSYFISILDTYLKTDTEYKYEYSERPVAPATYLRDFQMNSKYLDYTSSEKCNKRDYTTYIVTLYKEKYKCISKIDLQGFININTVIGSNKCKLKETMINISEYNRHHLLLSFLEKLYNFKKNYIILLYNFIIYMTYNIDIINLCINHYANNIKISKIASILNISIMNIYLWIKKYNYFFLNNIQLTKEDYYKIKNFKPHGSSKIYLYETQICDYVNNNNGCTLNDIIFNIPNINISKSSICNILKKNKISRKKINNRIIIKNYDELENIRINFINNITDDFFLNVIAIDESSSL